MSLPGLTGIAERRHTSASRERAEAVLMAQNDNPAQPMEQISEFIYEGACQSHAVSILKQIYLFKDVSEATLLHLASEIRAVCAPPLKELISEDQPAEDVYVVVSGEVSVIRREQGEKTLAVLGNGVIFGEISALYNTPQAHTFRTRLLSVVFKLKRASLIQAMQAANADSILIIENFVQSQLGAEDEAFKAALRNKSISRVLSSVAANVDSGIPCLSFFLGELLKAGIDLDVADSRGRTLLHRAVLNGLEECVRLLLGHGCDLNTTDTKGNSPLWDAMNENRRTIFDLLYPVACVSKPTVGGDLLYQACQRHDLWAATQLLDYGLSAHMRNHEGQRIIRMAEKTEVIPFYSPTFSVYKGRLHPTWRSTAYDSTIHGEILQRMRSTNVAHDWRQDLLRAEPGREKGQLEAEKVTDELVEEDEKILPQKRVFRGEEENSTEERLKTARGEKG